MPAPDCVLFWLRPDGDLMKKKLIISCYQPPQSLRLKYFCESLLSRWLWKGFMEMNFPEKCPNISLHYPTFAFYCLPQIHVRLNYTLVCMLFFHPSSRKIGKFRVDLCVQRPELHRLNTATDTHKMEIFHSLFYVMNGVPEAQSEILNFRMLCRVIQPQIKVANFEA